MNLIINLILLFGATALLAACRVWVRSERWQRAWTRLRRDRRGLVSLAIICAYLLVGLLASIRIPIESGNGRSTSALDYFFSHVSHEKSYSAPLAGTTYLVNNPEPLRGRHLLGTDVLGKDVLLQTLKACRTSLIIGGMASLIYIPLGTILGILAGYYKKRVDDVIQYVYSTLGSVPEILLLIAVLMVMGKGLFQMGFALGITGWVGLCRLVRGETLRQSERPYVEAARALGQSNLKIIFVHLLPNVMHLVIISFVLGFSGLVMSEAILSYIGVGAPVGTASWGLMIDSARMELSRDPAVWWNFSAASGALFFFVLSLNLLGDSLRRAFDPKAG